MAESPTAFSKLTARKQSTLSPGRVARRLKSGSDGPTQLSQTSLPAINNHILAKHIQRAQNLEQQLLEQELLSQRTLQSSVRDPLTIDEQDDAPLPSSKYTHMADLLPPDKPPETFQAWVAQMEQQLQQRLAQQQPAPAR